MERIETISWTDKQGIVKKFMSRYNILQDGKHVECNLKTWKDALTHAEKYTSSIFREHIVEIVNVWTGEIITLEEAQRRAKEYAQKLKGAVNSGTN